MVTRWEAFVNARLVARQTDQGLVLRRPRLERLDDLDGVHHRPGEQTAEVIDLDVLVGEDPLRRRDTHHVERTSTTPTAASTGSKASITPP